MHHKIGCLTKYAFTGSLMGVASPVLNIFAPLLPLSLAKFPFRPMDIKNFNRSELAQKNYVFRD